MPRVPRELFWMASLIHPSIHQAYHNLQFSPLSAKMKFLAVVAAISVASGLTIESRQVPSRHRWDGGVPQFDVGKVKCGSDKKFEKTQLNRPLRPEGYDKARSNFGKYCANYGVAKSSLYVSISKTSFVYVCARKEESSCSLENLNVALRALDSHCGVLMPGSVTSKNGRQTYGRANVGDIVCYALGEHRAWHYRNIQKAFSVNGTMRGVIKPRIAAT